MSVKLTPLEAKREKFFDTKKAYDMYEFMGFAQVVGKEGQEAYTLVPSEYRKAHADYLNELVVEATKAVREVVKDVEAFMYEDFYICVKLEGKKKFKQYIPPPGRGNGIYDAVVWEDFKLLLGEKVNESFVDRGLLLDSIVVPSYYGSKGILVKENATTEEELSLEYFVFENLLGPERLYGGVS